MNQPVQSLAPGFKDTAASIEAPIHNLTDAECEFYDAFAMHETCVPTRENLEALFNKLNRVIDGTKRVLQAAQTSTSGDKGSGIPVNHKMDYYFSAIGLRQTVHDELVRMTPAVTLNQFQYGQQDFIPVLDPNRVS